MGWVGTVDAQADMSHHWVHMSEGTFSDIAPQLDCKVNEIPGPSCSKRR